MKKFLAISAIFCLATTSANALEIKSRSMKQDGMIREEQVFDGFGCSGKNMSPHISWKEAPKETKSFAVTVYDPDAPTGSGWWHWVVVNIPATYRSLPLDFGMEDKVKLKDDILQIRNDFGVHKFGGPCPPKGDKPHKYIVTVFALNTEKLDLDEKSTAALAGFMINKATIDKAQFFSFYGRN